MNGRQRYALTHPLDEFHMDRMATCRRVRDLGGGMWSSVILAVDR
ncbi:MAG: hypothetical protein WKF64_08480 [Ilumatobacteraceae bacterium]